MPRRPSAAALALCTGAALAVPALRGRRARRAPQSAGGRVPGAARAVLRRADVRRHRPRRRRAAGRHAAHRPPAVQRARRHHALLRARGARRPATGAFVENYQGQTYIWTSDDDGETWQFRPRTVAPEGVPASGFSDPEVAIDSDGTVYFSEINLANVAVSSSADDGGTYALENFFGAVLTDRQWQEADRPGELYFVANAFGGGTGVPPNVGTGHYISKSTDGGKTFTTGIPDVEGGSRPRRHPRRQAHRHALRGALRRRRAVDGGVPQRPRAATSSRRTPTRSPRASTCWRTGRPSTSTPPATCTSPGTRAARGARDAGVYLATLARRRPHLVARRSASTTAATRRSGRGWRSATTGRVGHRLARGRRRAARQRRGDARRPRLADARRR